MMCALFMGILQVVLDSLLAGRSARFG